MSQGRPDAGPPARPGPIERRAWVERTADRLMPSRFRRYREQILYLAVGDWNTLFGLERQQPTQAHVDRRTAEGKTKAEIIRCLKRFLAREVWA